MPDVPRTPKPEPEPTLAEKAEPILSAIRVLLTGSDTGRVRRPLLYLAVGFGAVVMLASQGPVALMAGGIAMCALLLLAWSDNLV